MWRVVVFGLLLFFLHADLPVETAKNPKTVYLLTYDGIIGQLK